MKSRKSRFFPERFKIDKTRSIELGEIFIFQGGLGGGEQTVVLRCEEADGIKTGEGDVDNI